MPAKAAPRAPYALAARELLRETLLDAAHDELKRRPWTEITMAEIASAAGLSRQTLYKEFGSRDAFAQALVMREGDRFLLAVEEAVEAHLDDAPAALAAAFEVFLAAAAASPLVRTILFDGGAEDFLPLVTTRGLPVVEHATEHLARIILTGWPLVRDADARRLADALVRLAISYAALPAGEPQATAEEAMTLLGPYVVEVLTTAGASARR